MATPAYARSLVNLTKRLKLSAAPLSPCHIRTLHQSTKTPQGVTHDASSRPLDQIPPEANLISSGATTTAPQSDENLLPISSLTPDQITQELQRMRLPRAVQATYLTPLRREAPHGDTVCQLQMRSYSVRNLEAFADFAMRAAYYLHLPASGPVPLPKRTERWTVPKSNFVHKKSQENFERNTLRRLITIKDGNPEVVGMWLGFLQKYRYYGIGMKANTWERSGIDVLREMDAEGEKVRGEVEETLDLVGGTEGTVKHQSLVEQMLMQGPLKATLGSEAPMARAGSVGHAHTRIETKKVDPPERVRRY